MDTCAESGRCWASSTRHSSTCCACVNRPDRRVQPQVVAHVVAQIQARADLRVVAIQFVVLRVDTQAEFGLEVRPLRRFAPYSERCQDLRLCDRIAMSSSGSVRRRRRLRAKLRDARVSVVRAVAPTAPPKVYVELSSRSIRPVAGELQAVELRVSSSVPLATPGRAACLPAPFSRGDDQAARASQRVAEAVITRQPHVFVSIGALAVSSSSAVAELETVVEQQPAQRPRATLRSPAQPAQRIAELRLAEFILTGSSRSSVLRRIATSHSSGNVSLLPIDDTPAEIRLTFARYSYPTAIAGAAMSMTPPERVPYCTGKPPLKTSMLFDGGRIDGADEALEILEMKRIEQVMPS